jgi:CheY-like chemotaxis protein
MIPMKPIHILLVDDNEGDILLTTAALQDAKIIVNLSLAKDGIEAIDFLHQRAKNAIVELPDLVLLDINLPKKNGHEVLKHIKDSPDLKHIPVIMLTTSSSQTDINSSYNNYANCYITKPVDVNDFVTVISTIENFWISIVQLPTNKYGQNEKGSETF